MFVLIISRAVSSPFLFSARAAPAAVSVVASWAAGGRSVAKVPEGFAVLTVSCAVRSLGFSMMTLLIPRFLKFLVVRGPIRVGAFQSARRLRCGARRLCCGALGLSCGARRLCCVERNLVRVHPCGGIDLVDPIFSSGDDVVVEFFLREICTP